MIESRVLSRDVTGNSARPRKPLWHAPSVTIARFTLDSYLRSGWLWGEVVFVLALYGIFWVYPGDNPYLFGAAGEGLGILALVGTAIMIRGAMSARVYLPLVRLPSRSAYVRGLVLATCALRVPLYLLLLALVLATHKVDDPSPAALVPGSIGLVANCLVLSTLAVTFSPPLATRRHRIGLLVWLVIALSSYHYGGPLSNILALAHLPLAPLGVAFTFGLTKVIDWWGVAALLLEAVYIVGLTFLAERWLAHRDLVRG